MTSLFDHLPFPNFGEILQNLLPDDDLPRHKYIRSFGSRMFFPALLFLLFISIVQSYLGIGLWLPFFIAGGVLVIGFLITLYGLYLGRDFEKIDKRGKEAQVRRQEKINDILDDRQASLKDRRDKNFKYSDDDMEIEVTLEPGNELPAKKKDDSSNKDEQELDYET